MHYYTLLLSIIASAGLFEMWSTSRTYLFCRYTFRATPILGHLVYNQRAQIWAIAGLTYILLTYVDHPVVEGVASIFGVFAMTHLYARLSSPQLLMSPTYTYTSGAPITFGALGVGQCSDIGRQAITPVGATDLGGPASSMAAQGPIITPPVTAVVVPEPTLTVVSPDVIVAQPVVPAHLQPKTGAS